MTSQTQRDPLVGWGTADMVSKLRKVMVRTPTTVGDFVGTAQWREPDREQLLVQHAEFVRLLETIGAEVFVADPVDGLVDAVYTHDPAIMTPFGAILLRMRKPVRAPEPAVMRGDFERFGVPVLGELTDPAYSDGGDKVWLDSKTLLVGRGYRTNAAALVQLRGLLGPHGVDVVGVDLPHYEGPDAVLHLMSVISPIAHDLAVVYEHLAPVALIELLDERGVRRITVDEDEMKMGDYFDAVADAFSLPRPPRLPREEVRVGALVMGARRPPHFTEPQPPAYDVWDAKAIAEVIVAAAFPDVTCTWMAGTADELWTLHLDGHGQIGSVVRVALDKPVWAADVFGVEVTLGVISSDDVAPARSHAHAVTNDWATSAVSHLRVHPLPVTPAAEFDLALIVPDGTSAATVESALRTIGGELLERVALFDEFRGSGVATGTRSLAWRLTFRHPERTLREKEIEGRRARLLETLDKELGIRPRAT